MRLLFLTSQYPDPPRGGGALRALGLMRGAAQAGHTLDLLCFADSSPAGGHLATLCAEIITIPPPQRKLSQRLKDLLFTRYADMERRFWAESFISNLDALFARHVYDAVHAESIEMAAYLPTIQRRYPDLPLIYGSLNAEADLQRTVYQIERRHPKRLIGALYSWIQWKRLTKLEKQLCNLAAHVLAVSEADADLLRQFGNTPVTVVKNGIDTYLYTESTSALSLEKNALVFTGTMDYRPNVDAALWFAEKILPLILKQMPDAHFYIVGHRPHKRLAALHESPHITITGAVPDVVPYLKNAALYIAPLRMGSGTRFKLMEAMAAGAVVVSTTLGAQGLGVTSGKEMLLADSPADFASQVLHLLNDANYRKQIATAGKDFVQDHFDWTVIIPHLLSVYDSLPPRTRP